MYKDKEKAKEAGKERIRRYREKLKGVTFQPKGVTSEGVTTLGVTYPDIIDKLTDPAWRGALERICNEFGASPLAQEVRVGVNGPDLAAVSELLELTAV